MSCVPFAQFPLMVTIFMSLEYNIEIKQITLVWCTCGVLLNCGFGWTKKGGGQDSVATVQMPLGRHCPERPWSGSVSATRPLGPSRRGKELAGVGAPHHQLDRNVGVEQEGHSRPGDVCAGFPKSCRTLLFPQLRDNQGFRTEFFNGPSARGWAWRLLLCS